MSTGLKIIAFVGALLITFSGAWFVGKAQPGQAASAPAQPPPTHDSSDHQSDDADTSEGGTGEHEHDEPHGDDQQSPDGTSAHQGDHALVLLTPTVTAGESNLEFMISGPDGNPVTAYDTLHEKQLHLIAVRTDLSGFNHVHPTLGKDGIWRTSLDTTAGAWRIYADFQPSGHDQLTLGAALTVSGESSPITLPTPTTSVTTGDYTVDLSTNPAPGEQAVTFTVTYQGSPVTDLETYLGAYGHIVILRADDLAYLHAHPTSTAAGPAIEAHATYPTTGTYRAFVEFQHRGTVHHAEFTIEVK